MPWVLGWWTQKDFNTKPLAYRKYADPIGLTIGYWYWYQQNGSWNEICTWYWLFVFSSFQDPFFVWYSSHCPCRLVWLPSHKNLASNRLLADQTRTMTWFHHSQFRAIFLCVCVAARISSRENLPKRTLHLGSKNCGSLQDISKVNLWRCVNPFPVRLKTDRPETMVKYTIHQEVVTGIMGMGPSQQDLQPFMVQLLGWKGPHNCWVLGQGMNSNLRLRFHVSLLFLLGADELNFAFGHVWYISGFRGALFVEKNANMYVYIY